MVVTNQPQLSESLPRSPSRVSTGTSWHSVSCHGLLLCLPQVSSRFVSCRCSSMHPRCLSRRGRFLLHPTSFNTDFNTNLISRTSDASYFVGRYPRIGIFDFKFRTPNHLLVGIRRKFTNVLYTYRRIPSFGVAGQLIVVGPVNAAITGAVIS
jgi:hypothetical protein